MKICVYELSEQEKKTLAELQKKYTLSLQTTNQPLSMENIHLSQRCDGVTVLGKSQVNRQIIDKLVSYHVKYLTTRTVGFNHIDVEYAKQKGLRVCHSSYGPHGVSEFTIMLILLCLRHYKQAIWRQQVNDFSLTALMGREIKDLTIGVMGTGRIGASVIQNLSGFGCCILAYDKYENENVKPYATYVDLDTLYAEADLITLHMPLNEKTHYIINKKTIQKMKDGIILINAARGGLMDNKALIEGIESQKIGALGLDTIEEEDEIFHMNRMNDILQNKDMAYLKQFPNVVMTQHMAFFTDSSVRDMITCGIEGILSLANTGSYEGEL